MLPMAQQSSGANTSNILGAPMKKISLPLLLLPFLAGCQMGEESSGAHRDNMIVLQCVGEEITGIDAQKREFFSDESISQIEGKKNYSYLIKLEDKPIISHLEYYSEKEKRFTPSICFLLFTECQASVDPDVILESGKLINSQDGSVLGSISTNINRRTGEMQTRTMFDSGLNKSFEGSCEPGHLPDQTPQKF